MSLSIHPHITVGGCSGKLLFDCLRPVGAAGRFMRSVCAVTSAKKLWQAYIMPKRCWRASMLTIVKHQTCSHGESGRPGGLVKAAVRQCAGVTPLPPPFQKKV